MAGRDHPTGPRSARRSRPAGSGTAYRFSHSRCRRIRGRSRISTYMICLSTTSRTSIPCSGRRTTLRCPARRNRLPAGTRSGCSCPYRCTARPGEDHPSTLQDRAPQVFEETAQFSDEVREDITEEGIVRCHRARTANRACVAEVQSPSAVNGGALPKKPEGRLVARAPPPVVPTTRRGLKNAQHIA